MEIAYGCERGASFRFVSDLLCDDFRQIQRTGQGLMQNKSIHADGGLSAPERMQSVLCEAVLADDEAARRLEELDRISCQCGRRDSVSVYLLA